jgi:hypothetical protein
MQGCFNLFINREIQKSTANILNAVAIGAEFGFLPFVSIRETCLPSGRFVDYLCLSA